MKQQTVVKTYTGRKAPQVTGKFQRDSQNMAQQGYRVTNQSVIPQRAGCLKKLFTAGYGAGETTLTATYELTEAEMVREQEQLNRFNEENVRKAADKARLKAENDARKREEKILKLQEKDRKREQQARDREDQS